MERQRTKVKVWPSTWAYKMCVTLGCAILGYVSFAVSFPFAVVCHSRVFHFILCLSVFLSWVLLLFSLFFVNHECELPVNTLSVPFSSFLLLFFSSSFHIFLILSSASAAAAAAAGLCCAVSDLLLISLFYFFIYRQTKQTHTLTYTQFTCCLWFSGGWSLHCIYGILMWIPSLRSFSVCYYFFSAVFSSFCFFFSALCVCVCVFFRRFFRSLRVLCMCFDSLCVFLCWMLSVAYIFGVTTLTVRPNVYIVRTFNRSLPASRRFFLSISLCCCLFFRVLLLLTHENESEIASTLCTAY